MSTMPSQNCGGGIPRTAAAPETRSIIGPPETAARQPRGSAVTSGPTQGGDEEEQHAREEPPQDEPLHWSRSPDLRARGAVPGAASVRSRLRIHAGPGSV